MIVWVSFIWKLDWDRSALLIFRFCLQRLYYVEDWEPLWTFRVHKVQTVGMDPITGNLRLQGADWSFQDSQALPHSHVTSVLWCWRSQIINQPTVGRWGWRFHPINRGNKDHGLLVHWVHLLLFPHFELGTLVTLTSKWSPILSLGIWKILHLSQNHPWVSALSLEPGSMQVWLLFT